MQQVSLFFCRCFSLDWAQAAEFSRMRSAAVWPVVLRGLSAAQRLNTTLSRLTSAPGAQPAHSTDEKSHHNITQSGVCEELQRKSLNVSS